MQWGIEVRLLIVKFEATHASMARSKDEMSIEELKLVEAREARADALKAIRHAKNQLGKASFALSQMETDFKKRAFLFDE